MDDAHRRRLELWEASIRAASAAWACPMPDLPATWPAVDRRKSQTPRPGAWRESVEPLVSAAVAEYLAAWFSL